MSNTKKRNTVFYVLSYAIVQQLVLIQKGTREIVFFYSEREAKSPTPSSLLQGFKA